jgi:hypothetical protein
MTEENIFNNGVIYKIQCNDANIKDFYIGSTTNLKRRIHQHKNRCNNENNEKYNLKVCQTIRENGGFNNWNFLIVENLRCNNKIELLTRERHFYDILKPSLNTYRPTTSEDEKNEYREVNKDKIKEYQKEYNEANKDKLKEQKKEYREANKDKRKEQAKEYREANKDIIKEYRKEYNKANKDKRKEYYEANKDRIKDKMKEYRKRQKEQIKNI